MSDFYRTEYPRAAKPYRCEECRAEIAKGETYCRHNGKQEGYVFTATVCTRCQGMRNAAWSLDQWCDDEGPTFGELRQWLIEEHGIADPEAWYDGLVGLQQVLGDALRSAGVYQTGALP